MKNNQIAEYNADLRNKPALEIVRWGIARANGHAMVSTNFRPFEAVVLHLCTQVQPDIPVLWVDHGYNRSATYRYAEKLRDMLHLNLKIYLPKLTAAHRDAIYGPIPSFDDETELKKFSAMMKLEPFQHGMKELAPTVWFTALRKVQNPGRAKLDHLAEDESYDTIKISPVFYWTDADMEAYLEQHATHGINTTPLLSGREKTFSKFLYYRLFYGNTKPTILCAVKTDNIYLKSAIFMLANNYPTLASAKTKDSAYKLLIRTVKYTKRTRFFLGLYGGTSYLNYFTSQFGEHYKFYKAPKPAHPVIIVLDIDSGFSSISSKLKKIESATAHPTTLKKDDYPNAEFIHVIHNHYIVLTPLSQKGEDTDIEYLFDDITRLKQHNGKCFNTVDKRDVKTDLSKDAFAKHIVKAQKCSINFDNLKPLLDRITSTITHYDSIK